MNLRTALLAGILAIAVSALHAEEFQGTFTGLACPSGQFNCLETSPTTAAPVIITFDINTQGATLTPTFGPSPEGPSSFGGASIVTSLEVSFPITNYFAIVGGQTVDFAAHSSGGFSCGSPLFGTTYECGVGFGGLGVTDNEIWINVPTESQYKAFKDPLASILLMDPVGRCGGVSSLCQLLGPDLDLPVPSGTWTITPVPEPGPLLLFLAGLVGLVLSRRQGAVTFLLFRS